MSDDYDNVDEFLDNEMGENYGISYAEAKNKVKNDGSPVTGSDIANMNLERAVADRTMERGKAEADLLIRWAVEGGGTTEQTIKDELGSGGQPKTKSEVDAICSAYQSV
jgi:hypothetical protein